MDIYKNKYLKYKTLYKKLKQKQINKINKNRMSIEQLNIENLTLSPNLEQTGGQKSKNIVYFHYPCNDGLAAAWVAKLKLSKEDSNLDLKPYSHGDQLDLSLENKTIYFLDMAPSIENYKILKEKNSVIVLDHHKSNQRDYESLDDKNVSFNMNLSGVGLAWEWFFPKEEMPLFLQMIQGRDLFKFDIEHINEFSESLNLEMLSNKKFQDQLKLFDDLYNIKSKLNEYIDLGKPLLKQKQIKIKMLGDKNIKNIYIYEGHKLVMVNVDSDYASDLGSNLSSRPECDFAILWNYDHIYEKYNVSMRSSDKVDVSVICKKFGGGGHPNASGCKLEEHPVVVFGKVKRVLGTV